MRSLVVVSLEAWDDVWRRNQHLVTGLLRADPKLRVLFVEPPDDPVHAMRSGGRPAFGRRVTSHPDIDRLWTFRPVKWLPRRLDHHFDERNAHGIARAAAGLGMRGPSLWINDPGSAAVSSVTGWPTLYDMTDDWISADRPPAEHARLVVGERYLLTHAAEVVACSRELVRRKSGMRSQITLIPNAVDSAGYRRPAPRPKDLSNGPVAVYVGTLHRDRLDLSLCLASARTLNGRGTLVLVGPNLLDSASTARLERAGILVLGARPHDAVIGYLQHADVLVVPHNVTPFTDSLDPIKLYEYQAVGRPVVSTPVSGFRDAADPLIAIASGDEFAAAVAAAVPASNRFPVGTDRVVADWAERVTAMSARLDRLKDN